MKDNNWTLIIHNSKLTTKSSDISKVALLLRYGICETKTDVRNYKQDFIKDLKLFEESVYEQLRIKPNFQPGFKVIDSGIAPSYSRKSNNILMPKKFLYMSRISNQTKLAYDFFIFHELSHMLIDQTQGYKNSKIINMLSYAVEIYNDVFLVIDQKKLKLDIKRIAHEIVPDIIALMITEEKYPDLFTNCNWLNFERLFYYPRTNDEMIKFFTRDPHAPIEIRLNVSRKVLKLIRTKVGME